MKKILKTSAVMVAVLISLAGCGSTPPQTAEEKEMTMAMQKAFIARLTSGGNQNPQLQQQKETVQQEPLITEQELLAQKEAIVATGGAATFYREKDGIKINDQMYVDFEGQVSNFGGNRITGEFTYSIENYDRTHTLKFHRAGSDAAPIKIATVRKRGDSFEVRTVTGKTLPGSNVIPTSDGFIVGRAGSAFRYVIGSDKVDSISLIDDYHIAKYQNGDVASTGFILLEKNENRGSDGRSKPSLFSTLSALGGTLGLVTHDDYVLLSIETGKLVPLDISVTGKDVNKFSDCQKKSAIHNECANMDSYESLYDNLGLPNNSHYYWSVDWTLTSSGPVAFYKTTTKVKAVDINKEEVHTLFSRTLGVNNFQLIKRADGSAGITAQLGFSSDSIENVEDFISSNKDDIEPMQTLGN